ncbi:Bug family tripartite tricarboxylate transporter substrate binding protein [Roseomonas sp. BN140053]|uniref:Bug family tripartite tricarboxylate transporter substrate binding protein n=1 Tax=Roseomonas sp. BN140053 TaxID=3391898 RepID=UPI0039EB20E0
MKRRPLLLGVVAASAARGNAALAQRVAADYPNRPVRVIVPYPPGGTTDAIARIVAERMSAAWGKPLVIENRAGAGANIGAKAAAMAEPDGYTLMASAPGPLAVNATLYRSLNYDPAAFAPISLLATMPNGLVVRPGLANASVRELIAMAQSKPNGMSYASQGNGSTSHLTAHMFQMRTGARMVHVPYSGTAPALADIMSDRADLMFDNVTSSVAQHRAGNVRILGIAAEGRVAGLPEIPTLGEAGLPDFLASTWVAFVAPGGTPNAVIKAVQHAAAEAVRQEGVVRKFTELAAQPVGGTAAELARFLRAETAKWSEVIRSAGVAIE